VKSFDLEKANCAKRLETLEQRVRSLEEENGHLKKREHEVNESLVLERVSSAELQEKILSCELIVKGLQDENQALKADQVEDEKEIQEYVDLTMELTKRLKARNR
jgi:chromosome segregation ATPase